MKVTLEMETVNTPETLEMCPKCHLPRVIRAQARMITTDAVSDPLPVTWCMDCDPPEDDPRELSEAALAGIWARYDYWRREKAQTERLLGRQNKVTAAEVSAQDVPALLAEIRRLNE